MRLVVGEILNRVAAVLHQTADTSDVETSELNLWYKYLNMSQDEWAETYDWQVLYKEYNMLVSTSTGNASVVLPADFRKLSSFPVISSSSQTDTYPETPPQSATQYLDTDRRVEILGNPHDRYILRVYGVSLSSGASVKVPYFSSAGSLATTTDISPIPEPAFLMKRTIAHVWEARRDARFPQIKEEANRILRNLLERENVHSEASTNDRIRTVDETRHNFRIGRN